MLPLHTHARWSGPRISGVFKVLADPEANQSRLPRDQCLRLVGPGEVLSDGSVKGWAGVAYRGEPLRVAPSVPTLHSFALPTVISSGDVIRIRGDSLVTVLYRRGANANSLFVTERCNSKCLMCSQPPRDEDDRWRLDEIARLVPLVDPDVATLGVTGGEPTLLGADLVRLLTLCGTHLPTTHLHILTNGRRFRDVEFSSECAAATQNVTWAIPLYADVGSIHDYVVQARGAFEETLDGLYNLHERRQRLEVRFVLHKQTVPRARQFAEFVYRNLPFVDHVTFMGLEPMGFAKMNREALWVDPMDYSTELRDAVTHLAARGVPVSIYNLPLCAIAPEVRQFARQSISDWKNSYVSACESCAAKHACAGFFASAGPAWISRGVTPIAWQGEAA